MRAEVRGFLEEDWPILVAMMEEFGDYLVAMDPHHRLIRHRNYGEHLVSTMLTRAAQERGVVFVAAADSRPVGFGAGVLQTPSESDLYEVRPYLAGRVIELYVEARSRRMGLGTRLMEGLEAFFREKDCDTVKIEVFAPNGVARDFYAALGYGERDIDLMKSL